MAYYYQKQEECGIVTLTNPAIFKSREEIDEHFEFHDILNIKFKEYFKNADVTKKDSRQM